MTSLNALRPQANSYYRETEAVAERWLIVRITITVAIKLLRRGVRSFQQRQAFGQLKLGHELRGVAGLYSANRQTGKDVTRVGFRAFVASLKLDERYPCIQARAQAFPQSLLILQSHWPEYRVVSIVSSAQTP